MDSETRRTDKGGLTDVRDKVCLAKFTATHIAVKPLYFTYFTLCLWILAIVSKMNIRLLAEY